MSEPAMQGLRNVLMGLGAMAAGYGLIVLIWVCT